jgi:hypothetical protein
VDYNEKSNKRLKIILEENKIMTTNGNKVDERARDQAKAQLSGIMEMVKRLEHAQDCQDIEQCELTDQEIIEGLGYYYDPNVLAKATDEQKEQYHDNDAAIEAINEDPLSVEVRTDWHTPGSKDNKPTDFMILLCTGGPAVRIIGELDEYSQPTRARIEYQDWFTAWEEYICEHEEYEALLTYSQQFYFEDNC